MLQIGISKGKKYGILTCDTIQQTKGGIITAYFHNEKTGRTVRQFKGRLETCFSVEDKSYYVSDDARELEIQ